MKINKIGERKLIEAIWKIMGQKNEDEDVHFIVSDEEYTILAMDTINENYHFRREWDPRMVGRFIVDINLSDIASKNGKPFDFMVSMSFPSDIEENYVLKLAEGIRDECNRYDLKFSGGDLKEGDTVSLTGLVIGKVKLGNEFRRNGARPGDYVYITGMIGKQEKAIMEIKKGIGKGEDVLNITPKFAELGKMNKFTINSCIDNSDGVYKSLSLISSLSGVSIRITGNVCVQQGDDHWRRLCYSLGGDYELIFTSPDLINDFPILGIVTDGEGVIDIDGTPVDNRGYDHFRSSDSFNDWKE